MLKYLVVAATLFTPISIAAAAAAPSRTAATGAFLASRPRSELVNPDGPVIIGYPSRAVYCAHYGDVEPEHTARQIRAEGYSDTDAAAGARRVARFGIVVFRNGERVDVESKADWNCGDAGTSYANFRMAKVRAGASSAWVLADYLAP